MKLSIVSTLYMSAPYVAEFCQRASAVASQMFSDSYEIILVNDGSPDNSLELAIKLAENDPHIIVVDLSRNFGHHQAMKIGLEYAEGELVFLLDSDLEEEPEWLRDFSSQLESEKADVIFGVQQSRKGSFFERWSGSLYYKIFRWLSDIDHPENVVTARLMTKRYVNSLLAYKEREMVISCLYVITGYKQCSRVVIKHMSSKTTYSFYKKVSHLVNAVTSFSAAPLRLIFYCGVSIFFLAAIYASLLILKYIFQSQSVDGWTSIMVSIWFLGGMIISFIGIIGIYLSKVFIEAKQRPYVLIRDVFGKAKR